MVEEISARSHCGSISKYKKYINTLPPLFFLCFFDIDEYTMSLFNRDTELDLGLSILC